MTELTAFTIAEIRDGLAAPALLRRRTDRRPISARWRRRAQLNAYIVETPDKALAMAAASDERIAKGEARPLEGVPLGIKDLFCTEGVHSQAAQPRARRLPAALRIDRDRQSVGRRRGDAGQAQHGRVRHGLVQRDFLLRPGGQPVAVDGLERAAGARRLVRRLGGGRCGAPLRRRHGDRHRRLDPPARRVHRHGRHQADLRPLLALGHRRLRLVARPGRADRPRRARRGDHAEIDGERRPQGHHLGRHAGARLRAGDRAGGEGPEDRHSEGIPRRRHAGGDRGAVGAGQGVARRGRRRDGRHLAAAHQICFAGLLHRRAGRSLVQPRPL